MCIGVVQNDDLNVLLNLFILFSYRLENASSFGGEHPNGVILREVSGRISSIDKSAASPLAMQHMPVSKICCLVLLKSILTF